MIQLHDVRTAARLLGISHYTVRLLIGKGVLNPVRIGRRVLLEEQELQRFIERAKADPKGVERCHA